MMQTALLYRVSSCGHNVVRNIKWSKYWSFPSNQHRRIHFQMFNMVAIWRVNIKYRKEISFESNQWVHLLNCMTWLYFGRCHIDRMLSVWSQMKLFSFGTILISLGLSDVIRELKVRLLLVLMRKYFVMISNEFRWEHTKSIYVIRMHDNGDSIMCSICSCHHDFYVCHRRVDVGVQYVSQCVCHVHV